MGGVDMPKTKRTPRIETRLAPADFIAFDQLCRLEGKTRSELAREALRWFMANHERARQEKTETPLERRLKKMEDRLAGLMVKNGLDIGTMYALMWSRTDETTRKALFKEMRVRAIKRMKEQLSPEEQELKKALAD